MKIALLSRPDKAVRPDTTSSRPRVVLDLANGLMKLGHEVTVFGSGDSQVSCKLEAVSPIAIEKMPEAENQEYLRYSYMIKMIERAIELSDQFDIVHNHDYPEFIPLLAANRFKSPIVTTIHTQVVPHINDAFGYYSNTPFVALSKKQKTIGTKVNYVDVVYNGIDIDKFSFKQEAGDYLLFFGRMKIFKDVDGREVDPKGVLKAIEIAESTGENLIIAGNVEDPQFFEMRIKPHLNDRIRFVGPISKIGPIGPEQKVELYRNAKALLNPIDWEEPFGLVMVEAMACGTPVISMNRGAASEIIDNGRDGFICDSLQEMIDAVSKLSTINRHTCREKVEQNFTVDHMAKGYQAVYEKIIKANQ